ncbi:MAG: glycosyltransferase family 9 protein [Alphaproteobacteria bacterium]|nr:glycosyltransferase family 9 protein [Alphaproteobacteria bacterium]
MKALGPPYARPELRGRYLIRNRVKALAMTAIDAGLSLLPRRAVPAMAAPRRILLCNWAHLGDVVLTHPAVERVRAAWPGARIDFLTQTGSRQVVEAFTGIDRIHTLDHWNLSRTSLSVGQKRARYLQDRRALVAELASRRYDLAIDFYQHYPTAAFELWKAGIPVRVGYSSGGFSPLLTHALDWSRDDRHVIERHGDLVNLIAPASRELSLVASYPPASPETLAALNARGVPARYALLHTGTGGAFKEWPEEQWAELVSSLVARGWPLVLTGAGSRETERNRRLAAHDPSILDLTGALNWAGFTALVANADLLIGLDSVASHLGAAFQVPTVSVRTGAVSNKVWGPLNARALAVTSPTPCAPCHRTGCDTMDCIMRVTEADVTSAIDRLSLPSAAPVAEPQSAPALRERR